RALNDQLFAYTTLFRSDGGAGADSMDGGAGINALSYVGSSTGVYINLGNCETAGGDAQGDNIAPTGVVNFQNVTGSDFNDVLFGDGRANLLHAGTVPYY